MRTLREYIKEAEEGGTAIGHFNISNLEIFHGVYSAAKVLSASAGRKIPIIIGLSEGEEDFVGRTEAVAIIREVREKDDYPIFLNADHHYSFEKVAVAIDAGFDSVIFDGTKMPFEKNVEIAKQCVEYARAKEKETGREILVEAELGYIGSGSDVKDKIPEGAGLKTSPEEAKKFVEATGVDLLAPSVGSIHGIVKGGEPEIDGTLVAEIRRAGGVPLVLHGGSGLRDEDFKNAINSGIAVIHISTELRLAYDEALKKSMSEHPNEIAPYKFLEPVVRAVEKVAEARLRLFNKINLKLV